MDVNPTELLATAVSALFLGIPVAVMVAAGVLAAPRGRAGVPGLGIGIGLLLGLLLAGASTVTGPGLLGTLAAAAMTLGLACATAAAVLILLRRATSAIETVLGTAGCVLIGLGEPGQSLPVMVAMTPSVLVVATALVIEAVVIVALAAILAYLGGRLGPVRVGVAVAAVVAGAMMLWGLAARGTDHLVGLDIPAVPLLEMLIVTAGFFLIGVIVGAVLGPRRDQRLAASSGQPPDHAA